LCLIFMIPKYSWGYTVWHWGHVSTEKMVFGPRVIKTGKFKVGEKSFYWRDRLKKRLINLADSCECKFSD
jgi:hypothetical protein